MEREIERVREREPVLCNYKWNEDRYEVWEKEKKTLAKLPRVVKWDAVPWEVNYMGQLKILTGSNLIEHVPSRTPIRTMTARVQYQPPGSCSGKHRHFNEAFFYILTGKGWNVHDGVRYDWQAGDALCVPTYCTHQIFVDPGAESQIFFITTYLYDLLGLGLIEQFDLDDRWEFPEGSLPLRGTDGSVIGYRRKDGFEVRFLEQYAPRQFVTQKQSRAVETGTRPKDGYERYVSLYTQESRWRSTCPQVIRTGEMQWENTRQGRLKYIANPKSNFGLRAFEVYLQEIPPGGRSGKHRHVGEEVHFILEGKGYDVQDGVRYDWETNDTVCVPILTTHQHFNADPKRPARFLSVGSQMYEIIGHGGIEHLEDAYPL